MFTLSLTTEEATVLRAVLGRIGGSSHNTVRKHLDSLSIKLDSQGSSDYPYDMFGSTELYAASNSIDLLDHHLGTNTDLNFEI